MKNTRPWDEFYKTYFIIIKSEVDLKNSAINEGMIHFHISTFTTVAAQSSKNFNIISSSRIQHKSATIFFAA
jgi:hypothetical protein